MKRQKTFFLVLTLAWMGVIFYLSSLPDLATPLPVWWDTILRKIAHAAEFGLLVYFISGFLGFGRRPQIAFAIAILYAITDEYHQTFVSGRYGSVVDIIIDTIGVTLTVFLMQKNRWFRRFFVERFI